MSDIGDPGDLSAPEPSWNPDAHLDRVFRRGRRLRARRRLAVMAGGTLALVLLAMVATGLGFDPGAVDRGRRVATAGAGAQPGATTSAGSPTSGGPPKASGTGGGVAGGVGAAGALDRGGPGGGGGGTTSTTVTTGSGSVSGGTSGGGVTATTAPHHVTTNPTSSTTIAATTTTTAQGATTTMGPAVDCGPGDLASRTATDGTSYATGSAVAISLVLRNVSGHTCTAPSYAGIGATATITGTGAPVTTNGPAIACTARCQSPVLAPGQSASYSAGSWADARRGTYQAVASRLGSSGTAASFKVS